MTLFEIFITVIGTTIVIAVLAFTFAMCKLNGILSRDEERIIKQREEENVSDSN